MSKALTRNSSLSDYHAPTHKPSYVNKFHIYLIAVVALAVSAFLFALLG